MIHIKRLLNFLIIGLAAYVLIFRVPWYIGTIQVESMIATDSAYMNCLTRIESLGDDWEDRLAWLVFVRPIAKLSSGPQEGIVPSGLSLIGIVNRPLADGVESVIELSKAAVATENTLHVLANLSEVRRSTELFLADPSKKSLKSLRATHVEYVDDLEFAKMQLNHLQPIVTEIEAISSGVTGEIAQLGSNVPVKKFLPGGFVENIQALALAIRQAPAQIEQLQEELVYCSEKMNSVSLIVDSIERIEASLYQTPAEAFLKTADVRMKNDPPLIVLLLLVFARIALQIAKQISISEKTRG